VAQSTFGRGATVNNAAYSVNLAFKFHSLEGTTIYNYA